MSGDDVRPIRPPARTPIRRMPEIPRMTLVELRQTGTVVFTSEVTGRRYEWDGALSVQWVDSRDLKAILAITRKAGCCGHPQTEKPMFANKRA